jgi:hypothetical protein
MSTSSDRWDWKIRLLGAALGALSSLAVGIAMAVTVVGAYVGAAGIPAGAVTGAIFAPHLVRSRQPALGVGAAAGVACILGIGVFLLVSGLAGGHGGSLEDLVTYARTDGLMMSAIGLGFGVPMSLAAGTMATWAGRRAAKEFDRHWIPSAVVVAFVAVGFAAVIWSAALAGAPEAARRADEVPLEYVVVRESTRAGGGDELFVELRTYWDGERLYGPYAGGPVDAGTVVRDRVQESDWALWVTPWETWEDCPAGEPLVTDEDYGPGPVQLTITVSSGGSVSWERGIDAASAGN